MSWGKSLRLRRDGDFGVSDMCTFWSTTNLYQSFTKSHLLQLLTDLKCYPVLFVNGGNYDVFQICTPAEGIPSNLFQSFTKIHLLQLLAATESLAINHFDGGIDADTHHIWRVELEHRMTATLTVSSRVLPNGRGIFWRCGKGWSRMMWLRWCDMALLRRTRVGVAGSFRLPFLLWRDNEVVAVMLNREATVVVTRRTLLSFAWHDWSRMGTTTSGMENGNGRADA